jgi:hypothetical protein
MTEKLKEVIKREIGKLPKENQEAINSLGWENISEQIGKKYLLNESELNDFQTQTLLVLIGLENPDDYSQNIENEVGTSKNEAEKIADEVFQKIFTPINDVLVDNLKKSEKVKNSNAEQNLNFILSGGDYSVFLEVPPPLSGEGKNTEETIVPVFSITEENLKKSSV